MCWIVRQLGQVRHTMQFYSVGSGIEPDPTERLCDLRYRLLLKTEDIRIEVPQLCFFSRRECDRDVLQSRPAWARFAHALTCDDAGSMQLGPVGFVLPGFTS